MHTVRSNYYIPSNSFAPCQDDLRLLKDDISHFSAEPNLNPKTRRFIEQNAMKIFPMNDPADISLETHLLRDIHPRHPKLLHNVLPKRHRPEELSIMISPKINVLHDTPLLEDCW